MDIHIKFSMDSQKSFQDGMFEAMHRKLKTQKDEIERLKNTNVSVITVTEPVAPTANMTFYTGPWRPSVGPPMIEKLSLEEQMRKIEEEELRILGMKKKVQELQHIEEERIREERRVEDERIAREAREAREAHERKHEEKIKRAKEVADRQANEKHMLEMKEKLVNESKQLEATRVAERLTMHNNAVQKAREDRLKQMELARQARGIRSKLYDDMPRQENRQEPQKSTMFEPRDRDSGSRQYMSEQEVFDDDLDDIVRNVKPGKSLLEAYYALESVREGTPEETMEFGKLSTPRRSRMHENADAGKVRVAPVSVPPPTLEIREDHDVKIIETVGGEKLLSVDGVLINYADVATAVAYFASE
jgi:hypothetical protein